LMFTKIGIRKLCRFAVKVHWRLFTSSS
jgi:hypothetical protein